MATINEEDVDFVIDDSVTEPASAISVEANLHTRVDEVQDKVEHLSGRVNKIEQFDNNPSKLSYENSQQNSLQDKIKPDNIIEFM